MKSKKLSVISVLVASAIVTSCGGGGSSDQASVLDDPILQGVFVDSPVAGLTYETATTNGVTDADGVYNYREGESVVFSIGNLALPEVMASETITPLDIAATDNVYDPSVVNVVRLLQTLDTDNNPANGIEISEDVSEQLSESTVLDISDASAVTDVVDKVYDGARDTVSEFAAVSHFIDTLSVSSASEASLLEWQYLVNIDSAFEGDNLYIGDNSFSMTLNGDYFSGDASLNSGVYQLRQGEQKWFVSVSTDNRGTLACIAQAPKPTSDCSGNLYRGFEQQANALQFNADKDITPVPTAAAATEVAEVTPDETVIAEVTPEQALVEPGINEIVAAPLLTPADLFPACSSQLIDSDGDGYGWENYQTCYFSQSGSDSEGDLAPETTEVVEVAEPEVVQPEVVEVAEPEVVQPEVVEVVEPEVVQPEVVEVAEPEVVEVPEPEVIQPEVVEVVEPEVIEPVVVTPVPTVQSDEITDLILLTGQSNATALRTAIDANLDSGHERLFAFTEAGTWEQADLYQYWDSNVPGNYFETDAARKPFNNLVFQVGKSLAEKSDRVIGIILVAAPGKGISNWDYGSEFYRRIQDRSTAALEALPRKSSIDAILWMQGETDWLYEGTADQYATGFNSTDSDLYRNYYPNKLSQLISNLRSEWWFGPQAKFICSETKKAAVNPHLMALNNDGDNLTGCAKASDLPSRADDPYGNHFSAEALRTLGGRMADLYLDPTTGSVETSTVTIEEK